MAGASTFERIVVFAPNWLGDAVMALPAIGDVRQAHPSATLAVAARAPVTPLFRAMAGIDDVVALGGRGGASSALSWFANSRLLTEHRFDLAILLPNSIGVAWLAHLAGIPERWGYVADGRGMLLTRQVTRPAGKPHQVAYYQELVRALGIPNGEVVSRIEARGDDVARARELLAQSGMASESVVAVAPGAAYGHAKRWLPERFAESITRLVQSSSVDAVLIGSRSDADSGREVMRSIDRGASGRRVVNLIGQTDLPTLMGILTLSRLLITNDSGAMHLATALGLPVTAIFGSTDEHSTGPVPWADKTVRQTVVTHDVWCRPCLLRECPIDHRCMTGIEVGTVVKAAEASMRGSPVVGGG